MKKQACLIPILVYTCNKFVRTSLVKRNKNQQNSARNNILTSVTKHTFENTDKQAIYLYNGENLSQAVPQVRIPGSEPTKHNYRLHRAAVIKTNIRIYPRNMKVNAHMTQGQKTYT